MLERTADYEFLVRKIDLDPAVVREIEVGFPGGRRIGAVRRGDRMHVPGHGVVHFVEDESGTPMVSLPEGLEHTGTRFVPLVDPKLPDAPISAEGYWERAAVIAAEVSAFDGRFQLAGGRENGWVPILERTVDAIVAVLGPRDVVTAILRLTFGMLGVSIRATCENPDVARYVSDLGPWAEAVAIGRCMLSGEPGRRGPIDDGEPWEYTLSDAVRALPDPLAGELLYPRPPKAE